MNTDIIAKALMTKYPDQTEFSARHVVPTAIELGFNGSQANKYLKSFPSVKRGIYDLSAVVLSMPNNRDPEAQLEEKPLTKKISSIVNEDVYIPDTNECYVPWGHSKDVQTFVGSKKFFPIFISGLSGNGKTTMVEQSCAKLKREYIRVQVTMQTDEDDLLGGFRLIDGETVFVKGPVVKAMEAGAVLLIDEIDRGSDKIMALQGVLEGKPVLLKKTGELIKPAPGFTVIATGNTKGRGSDDGRYVSATVMDDAFLERFPVTLEQPYPSLNNERKILLKHMEKFGKVDEEYAQLLCVWSETIRKTYEDDGVEDLVTTRRLCHIAETFSIINDRKKAIELCINRFEEDTKEAFLDLYEKVDSSIGSNEEEPEVIEDASSMIDEIIRGV